MVSYNLETGLIFLRWFITSFTNTVTLALLRGFGLWGNRGLDPQNFVLHPWSCSGGRGHDTSSPINRKIRCWVMIRGSGCFILIRLVNCTVKPPCSTRRRHIITARKHLTCPDTLCYTCPSSQTLMFYYLRSQRQAGRCFSVFDTEHLSMKSFAMEISHWNNSNIHQNPGKG